MLSEKELHDRLIEDLRRLRLPIDEVELELRPYSKSFYGRYFLASGKSPARIFIYPYISSKNKKMFSYSTVLYHSIHEMIHHIQFSDPSYRRVKGVMHNPQFYSLFNRYYTKAVDMNMLREECVVK